MWSKQGKLNSCVLRRKAIETNFSRTLERVFLSLWIKKKRKSCTEETGMKEELKKELITNINYDKFLNYTTSVAEVYIDIKPSGSIGDNILHIIFNSCETEMYHFPPSKSKENQYTFCSLISKFLMFRFISGDKEDTKRFLS